MPISHSPPLVVIGISPRRYSHNLVQETGEFVVNVPSQDLVTETVFCGSASGRDTDKFKETKLTPTPADKVKPPLIEECVSNLECKVVASCECGDHTLHVGQIVVAHVDKGMLKETLDVTKIKTLSHKGAHYFIPEQIYSYC